MRFRCWSMLLLTPPLSTYLSLLPTPWDLWIILFIQRYQLCEKIVSRPCRTPLFPSNLGSTFNGRWLHVHALRNFYIHTYGHHTVSTIELSTIRQDKTRRDERNFPLEGTRHTLENILRRSGMTTTVLPLLSPPSKHAFYLQM